MVVKVPKDKSSTRYRNKRESAIAAFRRALDTGEPVLPIGDGEVRRHSRELAQAIVSNAIGELQLAWYEAKNADGKLLLDHHWRPMSDGRRDALRIREGLSAFAADPAFVANEWETYLARKMADTRRFSSTWTWQWSATGKNAGYRTHVSLHPSRR